MNVCRFCGTMFPFVCFFFWHFMFYKFYRFYCLGKLCWSWNCGCKTEIRAGLLKDIATLRSQAGNMATNQTQYFPYELINLSKCTIISSFWVKLCRVFILSYADCGIILFLYKRATCVSRASHPFCMPKSQSL